MRKRNFAFYVDKIFWYTVYMLPLVILIVSVYRTGSIISLSSVFSSLNLQILNDNIIVTTLSDVFGSGGIFPIFVNNDMIIFLSYFIIMIILHFVVDIVAWLPRLCHSWIDKFNRKECD